MKLIDISTDETLRIQFNRRLIKDEYPKLEKKTMRILIQFASIYFGETGFPKLVGIKTKYRSHLRK